MLVPKEEREDLKKLLEEARQLRETADKLIDRSEAIQRKMKEQKDSRKTA